MSEHRAPKRVRVGVVGALVLAGLVAIGGGVSVLTAAGGSDGVGKNTSAQAAVTPSPDVEDLTSPTASPPASPGASLTASPSRAALSPKPSTPSPSKTVAVKPRSSSKPAASTSGTAAQQVLDQINQARADAGAGALTISSGLVASAHAHNLAMADGCGLSHQCDGEDGLGDRISAQGVDWSNVAENIGDGGPVGTSGAAQASMAVQLTAGMLAETPPDDGHRQNILNPALHHIGIDVIRDADGTVWLTQDFSD